jgi:hypothetical protein
MRSKGKLLSDANEVSLAEGDRADIQYSRDNDMDSREYTNTGHVVLGIGESAPLKRNYEFILCHEFGRLADKMRPFFGAFTSIVVSMRLVCINPQTPVV